MKTYILILIMSTFVLCAFAGCDKLEQPDNNELYTVNAKVENASKYSNIVEVKLMIRDRNGNDIELARGKWTGGGFTIVLPKISRNNYREFASMRLLPAAIIETSSTITISNKNARGVVVEFLGVDKEGNVITRFFLTK